MSDWSKAFCGYEETSYGYATHSHTKTSFKPKLEEYSWCEDYTLNVVEDYTTMIGAEVCDSILNRRKIHAFKKLFISLASDLIKKKRENGEGVADSFSTFIYSYLENIKVKCRYREICSTMNDDVVECALKFGANKLTPKWVSDFYDDYY